MASVCFRKAKQGCTVSRKCIYTLVNLAQSKDEAPSKAACIFHFLCSVKTLKTCGYPSLYSVYTYMPR